MGRPSALVIGGSLGGLFAANLLRTIGWQVALSENGWVSTVLMHIGLRDHGLSILNTQAAVQLGVVYNYLVFMILPIYVALGCAAVFVLPQFAENVSDEYSQWDGKTNSAT